jgi:hypothetical protein
MPERAGAPHASQRDENEAEPSWNGVLKDLSFDSAQDTSSGWPRRP